MAQKTNFWESVYIYSMVVISAPPLYLVSLYASPVIYGLWLAAEVAQYISWGFTDIRDIKPLEVGYNMLGLLLSSTGLALPLLFPATSPLVAVMSYVISLSTIPRIYYGHKIESVKSEMVVEIKLAIDDFIHKQKLRRIREGFRSEHANGCSQPRLVLEREQLDTLNNLMECLRKYMPAKDYDDYRSKVVGSVASYARPSTSASARPE